MAAGSRVTVLALAPSRPGTREGGTGRSRGNGLPDDGAARSHEIGGGRRRTEDLDLAGRLVDDAGEIREIERGDEAGPAHQYVGAERRGDDDLLDRAPVPRELALRITPVPPGGSASQYVMSW